MNEYQIAGMEARGQGLGRTSCLLSGRAKEQWFLGYEIMDGRIEETLRAAKQMQSEIEFIQRRRTQMRVAV